VARSSSPSISADRSSFSALQISRPSSTHYLEAVEVAEGQSGAVVAHHPIQITEDAALIPREQFAKGPLVSSLGTANQVAIRVSGHTLYTWNDSNNRKVTGRVQKWRR